MKTNKVALITGAARGIGNGIAGKLAEDGYDIAMVATRDEEEVAESIAKVIEKAGNNKVIYIKGDISSSESREKIVNTAMKEFGRIDVLVNNAGVAPRIRMDILETTEESMEYVLNINLKGTFFMTQLVANTMIKLKEHLDVECYKPKIINISSISAYATSTNRGEYCISKTGISMITSLFADRLSEYGINVYEIRPGIIQTDMTSKVKEKYDNLIKEGITPIKRWGYPEDIAKAVSVICSGNLDFSTGEVINVDGGFHLRRF
ncbi:MAG: 3-ketoacyl-ACP reductase [Clostridiaceae bacterium]|nr:3-ketoacyl-ACP reductase [Clostridiaceae bacterium]